MPYWSADDSNIAFSSHRYGNADIFTIPATGGQPKRLTYHSAEDIITDYSNDGRIIFSTDRNFKQIEWDSEINVVSENGGTPNLFLNSVGEMASVSPDGRFVAFVKGWGRITREAYRGTANNEIWIYDTVTKKYSKIKDFKRHKN